MLLTLLAQIAAFGLLAMIVLAMDAIVFTWLGGKLGIVLGQIYLIVFVFNMDLNKLPEMATGQFVQTFILHVLVVNILLLPAWVLGMLIRKMNEQASSNSAMETRG